MRSLLFVPADSDRKLEKSLSSGADVIIVDLEDSVALSAKPEARRIAREFLQNRAPSAPESRFYVRINDLQSGLAEADLDAVMPGAPDGIMVPKTESGRDIQKLHAMLDVREAEAGLADGVTRIIPVATETAASVFGLGSYAGASERLAGMTWGAEDLSADLGAAANRDAAGRFTEPYRLARNLCLFGAVGARVAPIDTVFTAFRDTDGLTEECREAERDGFTAKLAIHPAQVPIINSVFTPSDAAVDRAARIVDAFRTAGDAGVIGLDGEMLDRPHLKRALGTLARAGRTVEDV
ncbi:MAG: CoA ester lyase [Pseudomonadota bacterium]